MAYRAESVRDEVLNAGVAQTAGSSLFKIAGGWGNVNGPGIFMLRVLVAGSVSATFTGLMGAMVGNLIWGTSALPFIVSACSGFVFGTLRWYADSIQKSLICLDLYPAMLRLHLDANYPAKRFRRWPLRDMRSSIFQRSPLLKSMLVVAWLTAQPALDEVMQNEESALITEEKDRVAASVADQAEHMEDVGQ